MAETKRDPRISPRRSPTRRSPRRNTPQSSWHVIPVDEEFVWSYAIKATQPMCFTMTCGECGPPYAAKKRFTVEESRRIEACYLNALISGTSDGICPDYRIDFKTMLQTTSRGTREVYREKNSDTVDVEGFVNVRRKPLPCQHIGTVVEEVSIYVQPPPPL